MFWEMVEKQDAIDVGYDVLSESDLLQRQFVASEGDLAIPGCWLYTDPNDINRCLPLMSSCYYGRSM